MLFSHVTLAEDPEYVSILHVRVGRVTQAQAIERIGQFVAHYRAAIPVVRRFIGGAQEISAHTDDESSIYTAPVPCRQVVTVNTEFVMEAQRNLAFRQCINEAAITVADGAGIVWASRYLHRAIAERVTGTDLLSALACRCAERGYSLFLLGAAPGIAELAGERLKQQNPGLRIAGTYAGSPALEEEDTIIERVRVAQADVLCVAYGAPAQELWIYRNLSRLPVAVAMGVGGAYDFLSGRQKRAPLLMQRLSLEWLYRLYREPRRWRRMLALPRFIVHMMLKGRNTR